jgi:phosphate transport system protein
MVAKTKTEGILQNVLVNYLVSQARTVEASINRALWAVLERNQRVASEVFLTEPRINEMEILIDEHAIRLLRQGNLCDADVRMVVATLKINNDLERMGDLAVNLSERAISLAGLGAIENPTELEPSDDVVDHYRDRIFEALLSSTTVEPTQAGPNLHFVLASRHLERIADHATNIAEDVLFWARGLEVRHGRGKQLEATNSAKVRAGA